MTKNDLSTSVKTPVFVINGDSVRLNTGPSALAPPHLTASDLCPVFHRETAPHLQYHEINFDLFWQFLSTLSFRKQKTRITSKQYSLKYLTKFTCLKCSLCLRFDRFVMLQDTQIALTHKKKEHFMTLLFNVLAPLNGPGVCGEERGLSA